MSIKYSIVIPTYNHCDDLLKPCIDSIIKYSNMDDIEIVIVANGCVDNTAEYLESLNNHQYGSHFNNVWIDEPSGYTKSTNEGIKAATGEYIVLLNNDTELLEQYNNRWLDMLVTPFEQDPNVGISGPLIRYDFYSCHWFLIFFCVMVKRTTFQKIGLLDEIFSPGAGEDTDFCIRVRAAGMKVAEICDSVYTGATNVGDFPIWHKDNQTFKEVSDYSKGIVRKNSLTLLKRYNKNIKLDLGSGPLPQPGYYSVDLYDDRAQVKMDINKLDFDDESVSELLASHVFEHLNPYKIAGVLTDWLRVLKPGGRLIMEMPNIEELCKRFTNSTNKQERYGIINIIYGSINTLGDDVTNINSPHLFGWYPEIVYDILCGTGFEDIKFGPEQIPHIGNMNFRVEAKKAGKLPIHLQQLKQQSGNEFRELYEENNYRITEQEIRNRYVIDIGANVGIFSVMCADLGAKKIIAVEAQPTIFSKLISNVQRYSNITPLNLAAAESDNQIVFIPDRGCNSTVGAEGDPVRTISLRTLAADIEHAAVLKLDCEGHEFNVLLNTDVETMAKFAVIHVELHGNTNADPNYHDIRLVREKLQFFGFKQTSSSQLFGGDTVGTMNIPMDVYVDTWMR